MAVKKIKNNKITEKSSFFLSHFFYNPNLSFASNSILWWTWESIIHHMYFIILFLQRQFSDKWATRQLYKVNMEKECEFFSLLFGGNSKFCAEATSSLFAGLWFRTPNPGKSHLDWIGRLITNYQHSEAVIHFMICFFGAIIVLYLGTITKKTKVTGAGVPALFRWCFFVSLAFETYTMCVPYLFLFSWVWTPFIQNPKDGLVEYIESFNSEDKFLGGVQFGAALITMFWVSVVVLVLDGWATIKAWEFARNGNSNIVLSSSLVGSSGLILVLFMVEFFSPVGRAGASADTTSYTELACDALHHMVGGDSTPMRTLMPNS